MNEQTVSQQDEQEPITLLLERLAEGLPALTPAAGQTLAAAASLCLADRERSAPIRLRVLGSYRTVYHVVPLQVTEQMRLCYNDTEEATEFGACAVVLLLIQHLTGLTVVERSRRGTGFDYWIGTADTMPIQKKARLEVSGIRSGDENSMDIRARFKIRQTERSDGPLPAYIVIVEFSHPLAQVIKR